jgi:hypothetical protein
MKAFFNLTGAYEGLRARRLAQCGRVVLYKVINDPPDYWLVSIRTFDEDIDRPLIRHLSEFGNGVWRFLSLSAAQARFASLANLREYAAEEKKRQNRRIKQSETMRQRCDSGANALFPRDAQNGPNKEAL